MKLLLAFGVLLTTFQAAPEPLQIYERGATFDAFLANAKSQRELWHDNASRAEVAPGLIDRLRRVAAGLRLLIVAEDWCPDSANTVPYIAKLAAATSVEARIVDRAAGEPLMERHLTADGRQATPTVVILRDGRDAGAWVERPAPLQKLFLSISTDPEAARRFGERQAWYAADRGATTLDEVVALAEQTAFSSR
jgi:hypothetical protein